MNCRVDFNPDHYPRIRVYDPDSGVDKQIYLHRLVAYAHGIIESPFSDKHVHHIDGDKWNNWPENLNAKSPGDHCRLTLHGVEL